MPEGALFSRMSSNSSSNEKLPADEASGKFMPLSQRRRDPPFTVGIIGGGPGGLMTAFSLQKLADRPLRVTLFEASSRVGGKILTPRFQNASMNYEAGAAEFYDYSQIEEDALKDLVLELGLPISPMGGSAVIMDDHVLANLDDVRDHLGVEAHRQLLAFDRTSRDQMIPEAFYHSDFPEGTHEKPDSRSFESLLANITEPSARRYVETLIHSDLATEPDKTSLVYGLQNYLMNDPAYMRLYGIDGGNERLPRELAARLAADILLEHSVKSVETCGDHRLRIRFEHAGKVCKNEFDFVVIALPHNQLASVSYPQERLADAMQQHFDYYNYPAHYLRITLLFEQPFWRKLTSDSYWMLDRFGGCCLYDESSRVPESKYGVLGWLIGGTSALEMSRLNDQQLIDEALKSLPSFLSCGRRFLLEGHVHRWVGAVNAMPGGIVPRSHDRRHQPEPTEHPNLFVVGDYLFDSTLNGVLDSAEFVASWLAARMNDQS